MFDWLGDTWDSFTGWLGGGDSSSSGGSSWYDPDSYGEDYVGNIPNTAQQGQPGYGWQYFDNGTAISPEGKYYYGGELVYDPGSSGGSGGGILSSLLGVGGDMLKGLVSTGGKADPSKIAALAGGIMGGLNPSFMQPNIQKTGYQGGIPSYSAVREQVPGTYDPNRRPGSRGQEYFTDVQFSSPTDKATAQAAAAQQATEAEARNKAREAETKQTNVAEYAMGGLASMAKGRYLNGSTDGMADKLDATIENKQPAKLSHGEFVVPADVVSHLGNGNSEAGAERLYDMMDRIRTARTGTKKQGKQINPNKYMPG
jgi:hypothetical protein